MFKKLHPAGGIADSVVNISASKYRSVAALIVGIFLLQNILFIVPAAAQKRSEDFKQRVSQRQSAAPAGVDTPISLTAFNVAASENFDSLANTGTSAVTPAGWGFAETGTNPNTLYTAGTGSSNTGDTYSLGAAGSTERALGGLRSGSLVPIIGAAYTNNTGSAINSLAIAYTGEEWRFGTTGRTDQIDFQYSLSATSLTTGTWTDVNMLDFVTPNTTGTVGARDGNATANRTAISSTISGLNIPSGATFFIRWTDADATGADDALAVDDFSLTPGGNPNAPTNPSGTGAASPSTVADGNSTLLTVTVTPGTNPVSSGLTVSANLASIGGSASQSFFDDGTNGDTAAGDNIFSYNATIPAGTTAGAKTFAVSLTDAQSRTASAAISLTVTSNTTALSVTGNASPSSVSAGNSTLLTANITPATNPASTGIVVTGDLSTIGGASNQTFYDDGSNGDAAAGDNIFSFLADLPTNASSGSRTLPINVTDAQSRTAATNITVTVTTVADAGEHLVMGNPTNATTDVNNPLNYLLPKAQYAVSYNRDRGTPNWVSWHLDTTWIGSSGRTNDFRPDPSLPSGWYQVQSTDYTGSGFDRGHHTPSGDRTRSVPDNSATFFMTNMMPQAPGNNQGPWERLESDSRTIAGQGNELYIVAGGTGIGGTGDNGGVTNTIARGNVTVPSLTWKVILIQPVGTDDVSRVTTATRTIAVIMPNNTAIRPDAWQKYLATVDQVEALTGYDFFSNVPVSIQNVIESRLDETSRAAAPQNVSAGNYANLDLTDTPNKTLSGDITVTGNLNLGGTNLSTGNFCVTLGANATVSRSYGYVNGCIEKQFNAVTPTAAPAAAFEYPVGTDNGYSPVTANVTAVGQTPSSLSVKAVQGAQPNAPNANLALKRYWTLTETGDLTADLTFKYLDADVPVGVTESAFTLQRYEGTFTQVPATIDPAANTATASGISQFSDWTLLAPSAPTAANVEVAGRITNYDGRGIVAATVSLTNTSGQIITARTNSFGYFRFASVPGGANYVAQARAKGYQFAPQVISLAEDVTDLNFSGSVSQ